MPYSHRSSISHCKIGYPEVIGLIVELLISKLYDDHVVPLEGIDTGWPSLEDNIFGHTTATPGECCDVDWYSHLDKWNLRQCFSAVWHPIIVRSHWIVAQLSQQFAIVLASTFFNDTDPIFFIIFSLTLPHAIICNDCNLVARLKTVQHWYHLYGWSFWTVTGIGGGVADKWTPRTNDDI